MPLSEKPYAESCDQNREPILKVLKPLLKGVKSVLEIGSGTGQHAVYFAPEFPDLVWQTSDRSENHPGIRAWVASEQPANVRMPIELDVGGVWPAENYDAIFSANAVHIMSWPEVVMMFTGVGCTLRAGGLLILYGPFNYDGAYSSDSNARFDVWLKQRDPNSGIRNFEDLDALARDNGLGFLDDIEMPVNNRILVWQRD